MRNFNKEHIYVTANTNASSAATTILATTTQLGTDQMFIEIRRGKKYQWAKFKLETDV